jgi:hypothetical protein
LSLSIANISVILACNDAHLFDRLCQRYQAFQTVPESTAHLIVYIRMEPHFRPAAAVTGDVSFSFQNGHFATPGSEGNINAAAGHGWLRLSERQPLGDIDYFLRASYALLAFQQGGLLFHGAGIVRGGQAFLFFGPSGSGKTTVSRLSPRDLVLNDDLLLLLPRHGHWNAFATPFWNPSQIAPAGAYHAPVRALLRLVQAAQLSLEPLSQGQALAELVACVPLLAGSLAASPTLLTLGQRLVQAVPTYRLHFLPDDSFWRVVEPMVHQWRTE